MKYILFLLLFAQGCTECVICTDKRTNQPYTWVCTNEPHRYELARNNILPGPDGNYLYCK